MSKSPRRPTAVIDIDAIFSVLPDGRSKEAGPETLGRFLTRGARSGTTVRWAEFEHGGGFLRGGVTDMADLSTRLVAHPSEDSQVAALSAGASAGVAPGGLVAANDGQSCHWYVPIMAQSARGASPARLRGLVIDIDVLGSLMGLFDPGVAITRAEKRLLLQLLRGATVREAAADDGVSFETKRAQVKTACAKLRCRGQSDLIRAVMGQLPHLLSIIATAGLDDAAIERFTRDYLAPEVRLVVHRLPNGRQLRMLEAGPVDGKPLIVTHGVLYPLLLLHCSEACTIAGVRVMVHVRAGYLDEQPTTALYAARDGSEDFEALESFIEQQFGAPVLLAGHSLGADWAIEFARRKPNLVSRLLLISPHFATGVPVSSGLIGSFFHGLKSLANTPGLYRYVAWQFRRYFTDPPTVRRVLQRLFEASPADLRVLGAAGDRSHMIDCFAVAYRSSIVGIADDMADGMRPRDLAHPRLTTPTVLIRGPEDPFSEHLPPVLAQSTAPLSLQRLPRGGHLVAASHPGDLWSAVAREML